MALTKVSAGVIKTEELIGFRNRIHNGDFRIHQRQVWSRSNTVTNIADNGISEKAMAADRWSTQTFNEAVNGLSASNITIAIPNDHPTITSGNCWSITVNTNATANANVVVANRTTDIFWLQHAVEGYDCADLFNTACTTPTTLSFWVKSNKTGNYSVAVRPNTSPSVNKLILLPYTISQSGVWEKKTLTIPVFNLGNIPLDNASRLLFQFTLASNLKATHTDGTTTITQAQLDAITNQWGDNPWGSGVAVTNHVNLFENTSNYWRITDIQWEAGSVASSFDRRPFGQELRLCQRYFYRHSTSYNYLPAIVRLTTVVRSYFPFPVEMRTAPSLTAPTITNGYNFICTNGDFQTNTIDLAVATTRHVFVSQTSSSLPTNGAGFFQLQNNAYFDLSSEL